MIMRSRHLLIFAVAWCLTMTELFPVRAQSEDVTVTFINGATMTGRVVSISPAGLELQVGRAQRTYPWYSLAPGTRFRLDQSFRMNVSGYLAGNPASSLTNAPDPEYNPLQPSAHAEIENQAVRPAGSSFDFNFLESRAIVKPARNPAAGAYPVEETDFWVLQTGPGTNDVAVFAFSRADPSKMATAIAWRGRPLAETATRRSVGSDTHLVFSKKTYSGQAHDIAFAYEIEWAVVPGEPIRRLLNADITLSRNDEKTEFRLLGEPVGFVSGNADVLSRSLLIDPAFSFGLRVENEQLFLTGRLRMSLLTMFPKSGMSDKVTLEFFDLQGRSQWRREVQIAREGMPGQPTLNADISSVRSGQTYKLVASMSLGPLLGELRHEENIFLPDPLKP